MMRQEPVPSCKASEENLLIIIQIYLAHPLVSLFLPSSLTAFKLFPNLQEPFQVLLSLIGLFHRLLLLSLSFVELQQLLGLPLTVPLLNLLDLMTKLEKQR